MTKEVVHVILIKDGKSKEIALEYKKDDQSKCKSKTKDIKGLDNISFEGSNQDRDFKVISRKKPFNESKEVIVELNGNGLPQSFIASLKHLEGINCLNCSSRSCNCKTMCSTPGIRTVSRTTSLASVSTTNKCSSCLPRKPFDDIDGPATDLIIASVLKLTFLKILLIDMGISVGDTVTDFLQGFNLIWDYTDGTVHYATFHYGIAVIATSWLPSVVTLVHLWLSQEFHFLNKMGWANAILFLFLFICLFPFMPTLFYLKLLLQRRRTDKEIKEYKIIERRANEIKSIAGSIEAPIQLIIVFWLMMRGILTMPWHEKVSATCVEDSLGRVACFPSIPMASILFSTLSIIKSMFNINISPLLSSHQASMSSLKQSFQLFLRFTPFFLANAIFRVCSYAFIILFIDYWAIIPGALLFGINLVIFGISFTRNKEQIPQNNYRCSNLQLQTMSTAELSIPRQIHTEQQFRIEPIEWNSNLSIFSPATPTETQPEWPVDPRPIETSRLQNSNPKSYSELPSIIRAESPIHSTTPSYINEENTSVFLNSISGLFIPSCHTHLKEINDLSTEDDDLHSVNSIHNIRLNALFTWQKKVFRKQVFILNSILAFTVISVTILVTSVDTFNYEANVISPFWFKNVSIFLITMWFLTVILAFEPDSAKMVGTLKKMFSQKCKHLNSPNGLDLNDGPSASRPELSDSRKSTVKNAVICFVICCLILLPAITGLLIFQYNPTADPHIYFVEDAVGPRVGTSSLIKMTIITAFPISSFSFNKLDIVTGTLETECFIDGKSNFSDKIIVVNRTSPKCSALLQEENFNENIIKSNAKAIIILDNTPKYQWRVSSPFSIRDLSEEEYPRIPILMIRQTDWLMFNSYFGRNGNQVYIVFSKTSHLDLTNLLSCTKSSPVTVGSPQETDRRRTREGCSEGKHLYRNGTVSEQVCVESECWYLGQRCPQSYFENLRRFQVNLKCDTQSLDGTKLDFKSINSDNLLRPTEMEISGSKIRSEYCCRRNDTGTSTFLKVLGQGCFDKFRDVVRFLDTCSFTDYIEGECVEEQRSVSRFCAVPNHACVIKEYYNTYCDTDVPLNFCRRSKLRC